MSEPGVGAWRVPKFYKRGLKYPDDPYQNQRVRWAIIACQRALIRLEFLDADPNNLDGGFGPLTEQSVRDLQTARGLPKKDVDGIIGPQTAHYLFIDLFTWFEAIYNIPDRLLLGLARLESGMDPGAEGRVDNADRGIMQFNRRFNTDLSDEDAFSNPPLCVGRAAQDLSVAYARWGYVDSWLPAVASHNSPRKGQLWAISGRAPDEQIRKYVELVVTAAKKAP